MKARPGQRIVDGARGEVGELVIVALVAEVGGVLGRVAELVLPYLVQEAGELARLSGDVMREVLRGNGGGSGRGRGAELGVERERGRCAEQ